MSEQLASFLRYSLSSSPDSLVKLADELAAIEAYLALQKTRFGNKLKVDWKIDQNVRQHLIPALLLQPLVENAIKYAVATQQQEGHYYHCRTTTGWPTLSASGR